MIATPLPPPRVAVAASGGRDSTALLHCTARAARELGAEVHALHVHHGLQAAADQWCEQVRRQCLRWARAGLPVVFHARRLQGQPGRGHSVEAWARQGRMAALSEMAHEAGCTLLLLAHHRRDQAETFLLQALRGAGPAGLSAMPASALREGITWARPWLEQPREAVEAYVRRHRLRYVDDDSNADPRFARNRLRLQVWPELQRAFEGAEGSLAHAARRAQEAAAALQEWTAADLAQVSEGDALIVQRWATLSAARRGLAIRAWLQARLPVGPPDTLVERLLEELPRLRSARWPAPRGEVGLHAGRLQVFGLTSEAPDDQAVGMLTSHRLPLRLDLSRPGRHAAAGWGGSWVVQRVEHGGVALQQLREVCMRAREGGEQFQRTGRGALRSLKKQYQAAGVPAWARDGPLLQDAAGQLLVVAGLGIDARAVAAEGQPQAALRWEPDQPR